VWTGTENPKIHKVTVPSSAVTGPLQVATSGGTATSTGYFIVLPTQDFTLVVEPSTATAIAGISVNLKVSTVTTGGYTGLTTLSTGSLPTGVTGTFTPPNLGPNASGLLTLTTSGSTPSSSSIEVRGTSTIECNGLQPYYLVRSSPCPTLPVWMPVMSFPIRCLESGAKAPGPRLEIQRPSSVGLSCRPAGEGASDARVAPPPKWQDQQPAASASWFN